MSHVGCLVTIHPHATTVHYPKYKHYSTCTSSQTVFTTAFRPDSHVVIISRREEGGRYL